MKLEDLKPLHDMGFSLIYLHPKNKRPIENGWTKQPNKTWEELSKKFRPDLNLGVRLGEHSKVAGGYLCCIDVDIKDPAFKDVALKKLKEITNGSIYPEVRSGSGNGSRHLYAVSEKPFRMVEIEKHKGEWEICAYSTGRQMVLPPSKHPNGSNYSWTVGFTKRMPTFDPERYRLHDREESYERGDHSIHASKINIWERDLPVALIHMIESGKGVDDRSAALLSVSMSMCKRGWNDEDILSVLTDRNNFLGQAAFEHCKSNDRKRAVAWLSKYTLAKARYETDIMRRFENKPVLTPMTKKEVKEEKAVSLKEELDTKVLPDTKGNGAPKPTLRNLIHILTHFMDGDGPLVGYNEFSCRPYFLKDTPYGGCKGQEIADHHDLALKHYIAEHYGFEPAQTLCFEAHSLLARKNAWHPIRAYLKGLEWDGVGRCETWLRSAFKASGPEAYLRAISKKVLVAAVKRIFEPGCKFDYMLVLEGPQGKGKSMCLGLLTGRDWFTDNIGDIHNKDVVDQMQGKWIIEMSELSGIHGKENEYVKSFLTRQVDRVRMSYGRRSEDYPRQSIFIGSTNSSEYLTDETGNRRYWPVKVDGADRAWIKAHRNQLWAEAYELYKQGEKPYLEDELEEIAKIEQENRFKTDEWELEIKKAFASDESGDAHTVTEVWRAIQDVNSIKAHPPMHESKRVGIILHRLGYIKRNRRIDGVQGKVWVKP